MNIYSVDFLENLVKFVQTSRLTVLLAIVLSIVLSSCVSTDREHGYEQDPASFKTLVINVSTKKDVISAVGSPSTISSLSDDEWYYITVKTNKFALFKAQVIENEVVKLKFNNNILVKMDFYKNSTKKELKFNKNESITKGKHRNALQDLAHNIGRFTKDKKKR